MKKNKRIILRLFDELSTLVSEGVLSAENAQKIRAYYGEPGTGDVKRAMLTIFGIIGSVLIGGGIILILAHNWSDFSRTVRTALSFLPLLIAQGCVGYVIRKRKESVGWCEGSSVFLMLTVASSIALIGQTYHIPADMGRLVLICMLLSLPVIYLLNSSLTATLYLVGIIIWAGFVKFSGGDASLFWLLGGAFVPHIFLSIRENRHSTRSIILCYMSFIVSSVAAWLLFIPNPPGFLFVVYSSLFSLYYLSGKFWFDDAPSIWLKPFYSMGALGITGICFILTYKGAWDIILQTPGPIMIGQGEIAEGILIIGLVCAYIFLIVRSIIKDKSNNLSLGVVPLIVLLGCYLVYFKKLHYIFGVFPVLLFNIYVLYLGIYALVKGIKSQCIIQINAGLVVIAALIIIRFFDIDISFIVKAIGFIVIGTGFFITNFLLIKQTKKEMKPDDERVVENG